MLQKGKTLKYHFVCFKKFVRLTFSELLSMSLFLVAATQAKYELELFLVLLDILLIYSIAP